MSEDRTPYAADLDPETRAANLLASEARLKAERGLPGCEVITPKGRWNGLRAGLRAVLRRDRTPPPQAPRAYAEGYADALKDILAAMDALEALR
jgi:hypothetical protein